MTPSERLRGAWCGDGIVASATLEAVSFATPALERFFIRTVLDAMQRMPASALRAHADRFVREEARHSAAHRRLNAALVGYLASPPPGLAAIERLLDFAAGRLSLPTRLLCVEIMERGSELASTAYLRWERRRRFDCEFARHLFSWHAREELGHCAIIRSLGRGRGAGCLLAGPVAWTIATGAGLAYLGLAVPWIMARKLQLRRPPGEIPR